MVEVSEFEVIVLISADLYVYVYVYVYVLSLRRIIASIYAVGEISIMVGDEERVDYCVRSCTVGIQ